jgi:outer membrane protein OmpA-like peptidoglycan-associated protein
VLRAFTLGPVLGYDQVVQHDAPGASTDARFFWIGFSLTLRPALLSDPEAAESQQTVVHTQRTDHTVRTQVIREPAPPREVFVEPSPELLALIDQTIPSTKVEVQMLAPVLFHFDSDRLQPIGVAMLHEVAHELASRPEVEVVEIIGAADTRGDAAYNVELSDRRARRVYDWLVEHGVAAERLQVAAQGASNPVEAGQQEAQHEQNRRVVFRVLRVGEAP